MSAVPYASATSGAAAREEITKLLRRMGCESVGFMERFQDKSILLAFEHRGRQIQFEASARGWAAWFLKENPWNSRMKRTKPQHEAAALDQGLVAVNSILRDWVKGQVTAVECGLMPVEAVFLAHMVTHDGRTVIQRFEETKLLPPPTPAPGTGEAR
ncbi:hypothetical protein B5U98_18030 [Bosea sp. Tri-39]|nr:hypothetical protein BLM15_07375 [Bosea sp. Tri-49]RXT22310.1 hypothetical protein B5U98_18030 [Bosea sp. Tri-39]RXT32652.1 hypothetical protein B5U99_28875 [Bosea sp. Tri-54]